MKLFNYFFYFYFIFSLSLSLSLSSFNFNSTHSHLNNSTHSHSNSNSHLNSHLNNKEHAIIITVRYKEEIPNKTSPLILLNYPHIIYNRGIDDLPNEYNTIIELDNVGKEFFIYLKYIYLNYHKLYNITIFGKYSHFTHNMRCSAVFSILSGHRLNIINDGFAFLGEGCIDTTVHEFENYKEFVDNYLTPNHYYVKNPRYVESNFFAVSKKAILRNPQSFYRDLARKFGSEDYSLHHEIPNDIQKVWPEIFKSKCSAGVEFNCLYKAA